LPEISAVCERVIIIKDGKIVAEDTPENLAREHGGEKLLLRVMGDENAIGNVLRKAAGVASVVSLGSKQEGSFDFEIEAIGDIDTDFSKQLFFALAENNMPILMQKNVEATLEEVFIEITDTEEAAASEVADLVEQKEDNDNESNMQA
jgi:ABC-2 type transport system ATP-binding protein